MNVADIQVNRKGILVDILGLGCYFDTLKLTSSLFFVDLINSIIVDRF